MTEFWPKILRSGGGHFRTIDGCRFDVTKWHMDGPHPKTKVELEGTWDGKSLLMTAFNCPKGWAVDWELLIDGAEVGPVHRTALYRDGGTQMFDTPLGQLYIPSPFKRKYARADLAGIPVL